MRMHFHIRKSNRDIEREKSFCFARQRERDDLWRPVTHDYSDDDDDVNVTV